MNHPTTRRDLVLSGAATGLLILKPQLVGAAQANSALSVGLIGCGRRGTYVSGLFAKNEYAKIAALCDIYDDQLAAATQKFSGARTFKN
ncbi:MAG: putative dehydrogenase, partial [Bryobacterales bacterium]|nr:putative dehydrogenase [Bryobacterales bacterium]